ncbi:MAG: SET domain-containing protein-lysine N-methyltransferase [Thermodesulfobacteriota bacterium]|nr:SET domain-containing protein-lysine N-methyltransferase [Thermodesulfobacteriota bacterium]
MTINLIDPDIYMDIRQTKPTILDFFKCLKVDYLPRTRIDWEPLLSMDLYESPYYLQNNEEFDFLAYRYGDAIENAYIAPVYIKKINDRIGFGLFAAAEIPVSSFIGEYAGVVQISGKYTHCYHSEKGYESDYSWYYPDEPEGAPPLEINGRFAGNEMRFANHAEDPNLCVEHTLYDGQWVLFFTAGRDIQKDEQLLISYGDAYWEEGYRIKG